MSSTPGVLCLSIFRITSLNSNKVKDAQLNPDDYEGDINAMNTAKIIALVVLIINVIMVIRVIYVLSTNDWDAIMEQSRILMEEYQKNSGN